MAPAEEFPEANAFHASVLKLPVWHDDDDADVIDQYLQAFHKVWKSIA